jgi:D-tyrosyl-tRNA(Tyr) deacylase
VKVVVQRVSRASVTVEGATIGEIGKGLVILVGVGSSDSRAEAAWLAPKCAGLRIFEDAGGQMNLALSDVGGEILVVSQFTLYGNCEKGRRPSFTDAASPGKAEELYEEFVRILRDSGLHVKTGVFGAKMTVEILNDGPVTLILER